MQLQICITEINIKKVTEKEEAYLIYYCGVDFEQEKMLEEDKMLLQEKVHINR